MSEARAHGPHPWGQTFWDGRAAANFACGGLGSGLVVAAAVSGAAGAAFALPVVAGLAIVACGLASVFAEIGRPLRAANVVLNPRASWMTREALVAPLLFAAGLAAASGMTALAWPAALLALAFLYCQGRMLHAARGIPAWRAPQVPWLLVATGLTEGAGAWLALAAFTGARPLPVATLFAIALVARAVAFLQFRRTRGLAPQAQAAIDASGRWLLNLGTLVALALLVLAAASTPYPWSRFLLLAAGLAGALPGLALKVTLVLRAGYTEATVLPAFPVRGVRA